MREDPCIYSGYAHLFQVSAARYQPHPLFPNPPDPPSLPRAPTLPTSVNPQAQPLPTPVLLPLPLPERPPARAPQPPNYPSPALSLSLFRHPPHPTPCAASPFQYPHAAAITIHSQLAECNRASEPIVRATQPSSLIALDVQGQDWSPRTLHLLRRRPGRLGSAGEKKDGRLRCGER